VADFCNACITPDGKWKGLSSQTSRRDDVGNSDFEFTLLVLKMPI
jgi:hypothetical protein